MLIVFSIVKAEQKCCQSHCLWKALATDGTELVVKSSAKQCQNPCSEPQAIYQDSSMQQYDKSFVRIIFIKVHLGLSPKSPLHNILGKMVVKYFKNIIMWIHLICLYMKPLHIALGIISLKQRQRGALSLEPR